LRLKKTIVLATCGQSDGADRVDETFEMFVLIAVCFDQRSGAPIGAGG
jgi:hypothetical protein